MDGVRGHTKAAQSTSELLRCHDRTQFAVRIDRMVADQVSEFVVGRIHFIGRKSAEEGVRGTGEYYTAWRRTL